MIGNKTRSRTQMQKNFREMAIKREVDNYSGRTIQQEKPKPPQAREMAAAASSGGGFQGVRKNKDGSVDYGDREGDQDGGGEITVRSRRGAVVLDVEHDGDGLTAILKPDAAAGLISGLSAALAGQDTPGDLVAVRVDRAGVVLEIEDGADVVEVLIDHDGAAGLIGKLGKAIAEAQASAV